MENKRYTSRDSLIESVINGAIGIINGAINLINKIPAVNVGKVGTEDTGHASDPAQGDAGTQRPVQARV